jgi:putative hydrolase of the HAD superfamily
VKTERREESSLGATVRYHLRFMPSAIKAVIFDYGNVLCEPQTPEDIEAMAAELGRTAGQFAPIYWRDRASYDRAEMDSTEYWNRVAGRKLPADQTRKLTHLDNRSWLHPRDATIPWVTALSRQGLRTALLSNLPVPLREALENDAPWLPEFDVRTYSCDVRRTKPDREIYEHCIRGLGVKPSEAVFLDDRPENITGAVELGIGAILFQTAERAAIELAERFGVGV